MLSEVLVRVPPLEAQKLLEKILEYSVFRIEPFEARAAIELAAMTRNAIDGGRDPKRRNAAATYAKLKFDRQVVATAKVVQATTIYSDDGDVRRIAKRENIEVIGLADLSLPPENRQKELFDYPPRRELIFDETSPPPAEESDRQGAIQALPPNREGD